MKNHKAIQNGHQSLIIKLKKNFKLLAIRFLNYINSAKHSVIGILSLGIPITSFTLSIILFLPYFQRILTNVHNLSNFYLASGTLIGTMLTIIVSLSILPIQKSIEVLTPSFTKIYRNDKWLLFIIIILGFFCIISFLFSINSIFKIGNNILLPIQIMIVGLSIQCVKSYQNQVAKFLDPIIAVDKYFEINKKKLLSSSKMINIISKIILLFEDKEKINEQTKINLKRNLFRTSKIIDDIINQTYEVSEVVKKGIKRGESHLCKVAIAYFTLIATLYLEIRKDNLVLILQDIPDVYGSDVDELLTPIYEELMNINRTAVKNNCEEISQATIEQMGRIAIFIGLLDSNILKKYNSPLSWKPISYIKICINDAFQYNMRESLLTGARVYLEISPTTNSQTDQITLIHNLHEICLQYFLSNNAMIVNAIIKKMCSIGKNLILNKNYYPNIAFEIMLETFIVLIPLGIEYEKKHKNESRQIPGDYPYNLENNLSLAYLFQDSSKLIEYDEKKSWISPYNEFEKIFEKLSRHFRSLGDKIDFKSSFILFHVNNTIEKICEAARQIILDGVGEGWNTSKVSDKITLVLSFYWTAFSKMSEISTFVANESANTLSKIALMYHSSKIENSEYIVKACISNINSIAENYTLKNKKSHAFDVADIYMNIIIIVKYLDHLEQYDYSKEILGKLKKPTVLPQEIWNDILSKIEHRKNQLNERLEKDSYGFSIPSMDRAEDVLKRLIFNSQGDT